MQISQRIFALMKSHGMSQKEFSECTEISQSTISDWKRKGTNPSADKILKICEVLQVTPYELLSETDGAEGVSDVHDMMIMNHDEGLLIESFRELDIKQKQRILGYMEALSNKR